MARKDRAFRVSAGADYLISPDIIVSRQALPASEINKLAKIVSDKIALQTPIIDRNNLNTSIMHASISCKWTIRSDRVQNARTEGLNLQKNRKGRIPNICVLTAEPLPTRIESVAIGTGEIDCAYHFALHELLETLDEMKSQSTQAYAASELLNDLVAGKRLRDISDLPFDLML